MEDLNNRILGVGEDFKGRIQDIDQFFSESIEEISNNLETVKILARDSIRKKE